MIKRKIEWSALLICEIVFAAIGTVFTGIGILFALFIDRIAASPYSRGNVYVLPYVFCSLGIVFLLVFAVLFFVAKNQKSNQAYLVEHGIPINADVKEIKQNLWVRINNVHPYYVVCEGVHPYTGERLTFKSKNTLENPFHLLGRSVTVYVDFNRSENYYVAIDRDPACGSDADRL